MKFDRETIDTAYDWLKCACDRDYEIVPDYACKPFFDHRDIALTLFDQWLAGEAQAGDLAFMRAPKHDGNYRTVPVLSFFDKMYMTCLIVSAYGRIIGAVAPVQDQLSYDNPLPQRAAACKEWVEVFIEPYARYTQRTVHELDAGRHVLATDIRNFSPSVRIAGMRRVLTEYDVDASIAGPLCDRLEHWAERYEEPTGLFMGQLFTAILLKLYLTPVMLEMEDRGHTVYRYVDDIRLVGKTQAECAVAFRDLTQILGDKGLTLADDKTEYLDPEKFKNHRDLNGIINRIYIRVRGNKVPAQYKNNPRGLFENGYNMDVLAAMAKDVIIGPLERGEERRKGVFSFCLDHLGQAMNGVLIPHVRAMFEQYPDKRKDILRYAGRCGYLPAMSEYLSDFCSAPDRNPFEVLEVLHFYNKYGASSDMVVNMCRDIVDETDSAPLRNACLYYLYRELGIGHVADLGHKGLIRVHTAGLDMSPSCPDARSVFGARPQPR